MAKLKGSIELSEHQEQCLLIEWMELQFPSVRIFAIPNGSYKGIQARVKAKKEGLRSGVPDVMIPKWKLFIEMKRRKGGVLSPTQKDWISYLEESGYSVIVAKGFDDAKVQIIQFLDSL
jgi:hypothetical protein